MALAADVLALIPEFLKSPTVLGIGEIGLNKNTRNEMKVLEQHIALAVQYDQMILVHTPHLEDKRKGTRLIMDCLKANGVVKPERVIIDHVEAHHPRSPRPGFLGRHHALPRIEVHAQCARST
jgi:predicted metal-dependent TIM-barrel fold hydrolase